jgi:hypothetical protein
VFLEYQSFRYHLQRWALYPSPTPPLPLLPLGGHVDTLMHSATPLTPLLLCNAQMVSFSSLLFENSTAAAVSFLNRDSVTVMDPEMSKFLIFCAQACAWWVDSAHAQQLLWQIYVDSVSGTASRTETCETSALWLKPSLKPPVRFSSLNWQGHSGKTKSQVGNVTFGVPS